MLRARSNWLSKKETDIWHVGIAPAPISSFLGAHAPASIPVHWLPLPRSFAFIADPFAVRDAATDTLTVFVEALDYRVKRGEIHYYELDANYQLLRHSTALKAPHHLSYPFLLEHAGETYLLPEAHKSGKLTLYRAKHFPDQWEPVATLLDLPVIDASILEHQGQWWMFFARPGKNGRALSELHIAYADTLTGPWHMHAGNPVRTGLDSSRMGGKPFVHEGTLHLPVQDCRHTYGGAITLLAVDELTTERFTAHPVSTINPSMLQGDFPDGLHTLTSCGDVTLLDAKRALRSHARHMIDIQRRVSRLLKAVP